MVLDRVVPKSDSVVIRTFPDLSDQGRELVEALARAGQEPVWLVDERIDSGLASVHCRIVRTRSVAGIVAFLRAKVVIHTHGVFGAERFSPSKRFINIWHGMPVKKLEADSAVGRNQTDVTIATSQVHAKHLAETWDLQPDQVELTGLPRNDILARAPGPRDGWLAELVGDRRLVVWLPTFRSTDIGVGRSDGEDLGTVTHFEGATVPAIDRLMGEIGAHCIIKPHPLAPAPETSKLENVTVMSDFDLRGTYGTTLYRLLAQADVLLTDHSSVWIDFLLTQRPVVFAISDLEEYSETRGFYFSDVQELLPGPLVESFDDLAAVLAPMLDGDDPWAERRREALDAHHCNVDDRSAERVADLVVRELALIG